MTLHEQIFDLFEIRLVTEAMDVVAEEVDRLPASERVGNVSCRAKIFAVERQRARSHQKVLEGESARLEVGTSSSCSGTQHRVARAN